ncbi:Oidioi.mRNA.OKI2018_I69.chr1.g2959.t1.cds [Oikopleura dioica]|uniref:Oidioi.mRNA.OKI2018_I69.chr1.g2959.t1.cds n=1 Tax=Oikopleura dioica TaxID=34765 RepID=A0ABN7SSQ6_OIKDI|nr:Oidioi.mRNA.OKI2018_I69.chr1.g2959.t1.cds [Oikopleura dioica]
MNRIILNRPSVLLQSIRFKGDNQHSTGPTMRHNWRQRNDRRTMLKSKMKHIVKNNLKVVYSPETGASHLAGQLDPVAYNIVRTETQRMMDERTERIENYLEKEVARMKKEGVRPIEIENEKLKIINDFKGNDFYYMPSQMSK